MTGRGRRGFTLIELLMVIAILAILAGLLASALVMLRRAGLRAATLTNMQHVTLAVLTYLDTWPHLGDAGAADAGDFRLDPWAYLHRRQAQEAHLGRAPLLEFPLARLVTRTGPGQCVRAAESKSATHLVDNYGSEADNVLSWYFDQITSPGAPIAHAQRIILRSCAGTPEVSADDLIMEYTSTSTRFEVRRFSELDAALALPFTDPRVAPLP